MKSKLVIVSALVGALILTGCAENGPPVADNSSIRYQLYQEATSFNPFAGISGADAEIASVQFRALVQVEDDQYVPALAESFEANDDATVWTFDLRETTWSDGEPFTSKDVLYSFETYANPATASPFGGQLAGVEGFSEFVEGSSDSISGFEAGDGTFTVTLSAPDAAFLGQLLSLQVVPAHVLSEVDPADLIDEEFFREPTVGIGPFTFVRWVTDDEIEFARNDSFWAPAAVESIYTQYLTSDVARAQLETGEIDLAQLSASDVATLEGVDGVDVVRTLGNNVMTFHTAHDSGKLADPLVRQAILAGIDRQAIVDEVLAGEGTVPTTVMFTPEWAQDSGLKPQAFDPDAARELLDDAGWDPSTEVRIGVVPGQRDRDAVVAIAAGQLQAIGMNAVVTNVDAAQVGELIGAGDFDLFITAVYVSPTSEPAGVNPRLLCSQVRPAGINISAYCNPDLDELLIDAVSTSDQSRRVSLYQEIQQVLFAEQPILPLYVPNTLWGVNSDISGFDPLVGLQGAASWQLAN